MPYTTESEFRARGLGAEIDQLCDPENQGVFDASVFAAAVADSDSIIRSHVVGFSDEQQTDPVLRVIGLKLTRAILWKNNLPDNISEDRKWAMAMLEKIRTGNMAIGAPSTTPVGKDFAEVLAPDRIFDADSLRGY